jgi:hypothetical protein
MFTFIREWRQWSLETAIWNARFRAGLKVGGFKKASR